MTDAVQKPFKVAVVSDDGVHVDRHFGRATVFRTYQWSGGIWVQGEDLHVPALCGDEGHAPWGPEAAAEKLEGFRVVLAVQAGPHVARALQTRGIDLLSVEEEISVALDRIAQSVIYRKELNRGAV